jgi:hypothetical protein
MQVCLLLILHSDSTLRIRWLVLRCCFNRVSLPTDRATDQMSERSSAWCLGCSSERVHPINSLTHYSRLPDEHFALERSLILIYAERGVDMFVGLRNQFAMTRA